MVKDSLFLMKSMLAKQVFASIQVMKYLKFPIDGSKGLHKSEMMRSPIFDGSFSTFWNGAHVCFPYGQFKH